MGVTGRVRGHLQCHRPRLNRGPMLQDVLSDDDTRNFMVSFIRTAGLPYPRILPAASFIWPTATRPCPG